MLDCSRQQYGPGGSQEQNEVLADCFCLHCRCSIRECGEEAALAMESARLTLHSCSLRGCKGPGLDLSGSAQATFSAGSSIAQCVGGVWLWDSSRATLQGASVAGGPSHAILADGAAAVEVRVRHSRGAGRLRSAVCFVSASRRFAAWWSALGLPAKSLLLCFPAHRCCCRRARCGVWCMQQRLPGRASCTPPTRCWTHSSPPTFHQRRGPSALSPTALPASSEVAAKAPPATCSSHWQPLQTADS